LHTINKKIYDLYSRKYINPPKEEPVPVEVVTQPEPQPEPQLEPEPHPEPQSQIVERNFILNIIYHIIE